MKKYSQDEIKEIIREMPMEAKAGQLFLLAYPGKDPLVIQPLIEKYGICGCYISQDNAETFEEARTSSALLQKMSMERKEKIPLMLGVDHEGAWGVLVPESHTGPGNLALGALSDTNRIADMYSILAKDMLSVGYNTLLGPCADVNSDPQSPIIGTRSFGEFPDRVASCVKKAIQGARENGILTCIKHFPGHGATSGDTHRGIPKVDKSYNRLKKEVLLPFSRGIQEGVDIVMTTHILYPRIDPEFPATFSSTILKNILREDLGFKGIIITDSMNMGAIRKFYDPAQSTVMALKAGVDIVMLSEEHYDHSDNYLEKQLDSIELVIKAIWNGDLSEKDIDEKLERILDIKLNKMLVSGTPLDESTKQEFSTIERKVAKECFTLLRKNHWPIPGSGEILCINATPRSSYQNLMNSRGIGPNQEKPAFDSLKEELEAMDTSKRSIRFLNHEDLKTRRTDLENADTLIVVTEDYPLPGEDFQKKIQQKTVRELSAQYADKMIILGLRSSYEINLYPENVTYLCSYSSRECSAQSASEILLSGQLDFPAIPPVSY